MIKPSHYTTPRTMSEGIWIYGSDPIERPDYHSNPFSVVLLTYAILIVTCIALGVRYVIA